MHSILGGVRIVDFTQMKTGPSGTQLLADLGADVIKIERPGGEWERSFPAFGRFTEEGQSPFFLALNRNKRSVCLDLKAPKARDVIHRLVARSDVVVENFRPGVLEKMGYGYEDLRRVKQDIIFCSSSGYGDTGPYVRRPGQDLLAQALSGMVLMNGTKDHPMPVASTVADGVTGLFVALAVLGALLHRQRSGVGQYVEVDLMSSLISLQQEEICALLNLNPPPRFERSATGVPAPWFAAPYGVYVTRDERYIAIAMNELDKLGELLGEPKLAHYRDDTSAFAQRDLLRPMIAARIRERDLDELLDQLLAADIWCAQVQDFEQVVNDPQVVHNQLIQHVSHPAYGDVSVVATPIRFQKTPATYRSGAPLLGEHGREVLLDAGFSDEEINGLIASAVLTVDGGRVASGPNKG